MCVFVCVRACMHACMHACVWCGMVQCATHIEGLAICPQDLLEEPLAIARTDRPLHGRVKVCNNKRNMESLCN